MAYRKIEKPKPIRRVLQDTTTVNRTYVQNGATAHLAIPCWYMPLDRPQHTHVHDREWHDHIGWPNPDSPDNSSQDAYVLRSPSFAYDFSEQGWNRVRRYLDMSKTIPIHLKEEGYTNVEVAFSRNIDGLTADGYIEDYIIRFNLNPMCDSAVNRDIEVPYTVFITGRVNGRSVRDIAAKGILHIVAGPFSGANLNDSDSSGNNGGGNIGSGHGPGGDVFPG